MMTELEVIAYKFRAAIEKAIDAGKQESFLENFRLVSVKIPQIC